MKTKKVCMCNRKKQNYVLNDTEPPVTNLAKDRQKHQIK